MANYDVVVPDNFEKNKSFIFDSQDKKIKVAVSKDAGNLIKVKDDGLYAPSLSNKNSKFEKIILDLSNIPAEEKQKMQENPHKPAISLRFLLQEGQSLKLIERVVDPVKFSDLMLSKSFMFTKDTVITVLAAFNKNLQGNTYFKKGNVQYFFEKNVEYSTADFKPNFFISRNTYPIFLYKTPEDENIYFGDFFKTSDLTEESFKFYTYVAIDPIEFDVAYTTDLSAKLRAISNGSFTTEPESSSPAEPPKGEGLFVIIKHEERGIVKSSAYSDHEAGHTWAITGIPYDVMHPEEDIKKFTVYLAKDATGLQPYQLTEQEKPHLMEEMTESLNRIPDKIISKGDGTFEAVRYRNESAYSTWKAGIKKALTSPSFALRGSIPERVFNEFYSNPDNVMYDSRGHKETNRRFEISFTPSFIKGFYEIKLSRYLVGQEEPMEAGSNIGAEYSNDKATTYAFRDIIPQGTQPYSVIHSPKDDGTPDAKDIMNKYLNVINLYHWLYRPELDNYIGKIRIDFSYIEPKTPTVSAVNNSQEFVVTNKQVIIVPTKPNPLVLNNVPQSEVAQLENETITLRADGAEESTIRLLVNYDKEKQYLTEKNITIDENYTSSPSN